LTCARKNFLITKIFAKFLNISFTFLFLIWLTHSLFAVQWMLEFKFKLFNFSLESCSSQRHNNTHPTSLLRSRRDISSTSKFRDANRDRVEILQKLIDPFFNPQKFFLLTSFLEHNFSLFVHNQMVPKYIFSFESYIRKCHSNLT